MIEDNSGDYIVINTEGGIKKRAELVVRTTIEDLGEYVIYKLDGKFYGAKYKVVGDITELITDLNDNEKEALNKVFMQLGVE